MSSMYIAGPISGKTDQNRPAFEAERARISARLHPRHKIIIPHDIYESTGPALDCPAICWCEAMVACLCVVETVDMVMLLPGWEASSGARRERLWARERGIPVMERYPRGGEL